MIWGWSVDDVMLGRDGPENLRIFKKRVEIELCRQTVEFSANGTLRIEFSAIELRVGDSTIESKS